MWIDIPLDFYEIRKIQRANDFGNMVYISLLISYYYLLFFNVLDAMENGIFLKKMPCFFQKVRG